MENDIIAFGYLFLKIFSFRVLEKRQITIEIN